MRSEEAKLEGVERRYTQIQGERDYHRRRSERLEAERDALADAAIVDDAAWSDLEDLLVSIEDKLKAYEDSHEVGLAAHHAAKSLPGVDGYSLAEAGVHILGQQALLEEVHRRLTNILSVRGAE
ncbi:MAG: hypothetical protein L0J73_11735 [Halomonas sp.]|nr:hypothetical protein [Halomonas sp.]